MKKILAIFVVIVLVLSFVEIVRKPSAEQIVNNFDSFAHILSMTQITKNNKLIGKREFVDDDSYIGSYSSSCISESDRDVVFGGASVRDKRIVLKARILTESGTAALRVRLGSDVQEYKVDENGYFEKALNFDSGGNYIMIDYDNFTGIVEMTSEYQK